MNKVSHFEIPADNVERAKKFYKIFGWQIEDVPEMDYVMLRTVAVDENRKPKEVGAINGGMMTRTKDVKHPVIVIEVKSVDQSIKQAVAAGGKQISDKMEIGGMGYYAYVSDTEGNVLGLWETIKK